MKLNFERTFTAPFSTTGDTNISNIYLIGGALTLGGFIILFIFQMFSQLFIGGLQAIASSGSSTSIAIAVLLTVIISLLTMLVNICTLGLPLGYVVETIKLEIYDRSSIMPSWTGNYARFFWNGVKMQLIMLVYGVALMLIILIPAIIFGVIMGISAGQSQDLTAIAGGIGGIILITIIIILMLAYMFILPMILVHFAAEGRFFAAFNLFKIMSKIFSNFVDYIIAIVVVIGLGIMGSILYVILCVTCVGIFAIPLVSYFLLPIIMLNLFAQIYKD